MPPPHLVKFPANPMPPVAQYARAGSSSSAQVFLHPGPSHPSQPPPPPQGRPPPVQEYEVKSPCIAHHAEILLGIVEEECQLAVAEVQGELDARNAQIASMQHAADQTRHAYDKERMGLRRQINQLQEEASSLRNLISYAQQEEGKLRSENDDLKSKMATATKVVTAYIESKKQMIEQGSQIPTQSASQNNLISSLSERMSGALVVSDAGLEKGGVSASPAHTTDAAANSSIYPKEGLNPDSDENKAAVLENRSDDTREAEIVSLKIALQEMENKYQKLLSSQPKAVVIKSEPTPPNLHVEREKALKDEVERLKDSVKKLEDEKMEMKLEKLEMESVAKDLRRQIVEANAELETTKSGKTNVPFEISDDDEITVVQTKKRRITIDLT